MIKRNKEGIFYVDKEISSGRMSGKVIWLVRNNKRKMGLTY